MLTREFHFTPDKIGKLDFRLCYEAFRGRDPAKCTGVERAHLAAQQRELERVSEPFGEVPPHADPDMPDGRMRRLLEDGGVIRLSVKAFEKLETFVDETPFMAFLSMQVEELKDRLTLAKKVDSDPPPEKAD